MFLSLEIPLIAAGGMTQHTASAFILAGASAIGVGTELIPLDAIAARETERIEELAHRFLTFVKTARDRLSPHVQFIGGTKTDFNKLHKRPGQEKSEASDDKSDRQLRKLSMSGKSRAVNLLNLVQSTEAKGVRRPSWPSKPLILSFAARVVGSTPTRFRHILLCVSDLALSLRGKSGQ